MLTTAPFVEGTRAQTEPHVYAWELPAHCTLLGTVTFLSDHMVEVTMRGKSRSKSARGRFDGKRTADLSWENTGSAPEAIQLVAETIDGNRPLPWGSVSFAAQQHLFIGFGQRAKPLDPSSRHGGYPHDAVFVGFVVFTD